MNRLKDPDLKLPDLRVPGFVTDLYYDLRDRRLLPLVGLVLVAIVAVPFLLASGSESEPAPAAVAPEATATASNASELTVVRATPGIRDYRKRLRGRTPTDPFRQHFTAPDLAGTQLGSKGDNGFESSEVSSTTTTSTGTTKVTKKTTKNANGETTTKTTETEATGSEPQGSEPKGSENGSSGSQPQAPLTQYSFAIDLKIVVTTEAADGSVEKQEPRVRHQILPPAALPSEKTQLVTYMGINPKTGKPLLLVSDAVSAVYGEAVCLSGESTCQLLEVETGLPLTFVFGEGGARYKLTVLKVAPVASGHY